MAFLDHLAPLLGVDRERLAVESGEFFDRDRPETRMGWDQACAALGASGLTANGKFVESLASSGVHGAQAVRVRVDLWTGAVKVLKMVCVQDVGLPLNRLAVRSQINGGLVQALSYGLLEERVLDPGLGVALNAQLDDYKLVGSQGMPEMVSIIDEEDVGRGVIGVGEPPVIPGQSAIANAVRNACGVRITRLPITPDKVLMELERLRSAGGGR